MDKPEEKITSEQGDLFQRLESEPEYLTKNAPDLDIEVEFMGQIKYCLRQAKKHGLSRERITERMNLCLPEELWITRRQLDAWCAESKEFHRWPAIYLPAFVWAVRGIVTPIKVLTGVLGLAVQDEREQMAAELGKTMLTKVQAAKQEREIKKKLGVD